MHSTNHFIFSTLEANERRRNPILGSAWFEPGQEEARAAFVKEWHSKTEKMLRQNHNLRVAD
ncbi:hypothetical protein LMK08_24555 [Metapseudomonas furukawaii]|uniref:hypothetical protein n=1 Tax=Metapseudomonas furukawaii TaxID=1149133 RepID=UPI00227CDBA9|nr:hypothetical protein [Pseudomonas furukawaii]WAG78486.1 hypothetical protein LMK08_24555 [Pseudomonas furukawaii]